MGSRSQYPGVERNGTTLRIAFAIDGQRCREPLNLPDTPANRASAARLRAEIVARIRLGTFDYAAYFPHSRRAAAVQRTFSDVAQEWLNLQAELATSTQRDYESSLNHHWIPGLGAHAIGTITPGQVKRAVIAAGFKSAKRRNNCISPLRMVFDYAVGERYIASSPAAGLEFAPTPDPDPDPFTLEEARAILAWMRHHTEPQVHNYFRFAFFSGLRTSEIIQLQWEKVDLRSGIVRVDEAKVRRERKRTKTYKHRDVELNVESRAALEDQRAHTQLAGGHVFTNPHTGGPYVDDLSPRRAFGRCLKKLGIRYRPPYNTRHTYATISLMAGANPMWVARQLGHANMAMTLRVYSRWIDGADHGRELGRVDAALGRLGQTVGQNRGKQGNHGD